MRRRTTGRRKDLHKENVVFSTIVVVRRGRLRSCTGNQGGEEDRELEHDASTEMSERTRGADEETLTCAVS